MTSLAATDYQVSASWDSGLRGETTRFERVPLNTPKLLFRQKRSSLITHDQSSMGDIENEALSVKAVEVAERSSKINATISELEHRYFDDYQTQLSQSSIKGFRSFLQKYESVEIPEIAAESTGMIIAEWRSQAGSLSLRFVENGKLHFAMALKKNDKVERPWGSSNIQSFFIDAPEANLVFQISN